MTPLTTWRAQKPLPLTASIASTKMSLVVANPSLRFQTWFSLVLFRVYQQSIVSSMYSAWSDCYRNAYAAACLRVAVSAFSSSADFLPIASLSISEKIPLLDEICCDDDVALVKSPPPPVRKPLPLPDSSIFEEPITDCDDDDSLTPSPSIPTIIITLAPDDDEPEHNFVPIQSSRGGMQLVVPGRICYDDAYDCFDDDDDLEFEPDLLEDSEPRSYWIDEDDDELPDLSDWEY